MSDTQSNNKRIAKNSIFMSLRMLFVLIVSLYTTRVILNVLGVDDYGIYNIVAGFVTMFAFLNTSMAGATQRYFNYELGKNGIEGANKVYITSLLIHVILAIITIVITLPVGVWYLHNKMVIPEGRMFAAEWIFYFSVLSLFVNMISVPYTAAIMAHEKMNYYALVGVLDTILKLAMVFVLPFIDGDSLIYYGLFYLSINILNAFLYFSYSKIKFEEISFHKSLSEDLFRSMLSYSGWSLFGSLAYMLREQGVNLVLNAFFGTIVNAARGVANQVNSAINGFIANIIIPSRPQVIQSYANGDLQRTWRLTFSVSKLATLFFFMMALPISIEINYILNFWLGESVPEHTSWFIVIMLFTNTFGCLVSPISTVMHATGKMKFYQSLSSASNLLSVPLAYVFLLIGAIPEFVFVALFITMVTNLFAGLISTHKYANLSYWAYFRQVFFPIIVVMLISCPLCVIPYMILEESLIRLLTTGILSVIIVAIVTYNVALDEGEKSLILQFIHRLPKKWKK